MTSETFDDSWQLGVLEVLNDEVDFFLDSCPETVDVVRFVDVDYALEIAPPHIIQGSEIRRMRSLGIAVLTLMCLPRKCCFWSRDVLGACHSAGTTRFPMTRQKAAA